MKQQILSKIKLQHPSSWSQRQPNMCAPNLILLIHLVLQVAKQQSRISLRHPVFPVQEPHMSHVVLPQWGILEQEGNSQAEEKNFSQPKRTWKNSFSTQLIGKNYLEADCKTRVYKTHDNFPFFLFIWFQNEVLKNASVIYSSPFCFLKGVINYFKGCSI